MKLPLNLIKSEADRLESQRECGECTACCVLPRISKGEDTGFSEGKAGYTPCQHLCLGGEHTKSGVPMVGCSIYDQRPSLCRDYKCLWRAGIIPGDERRRPDRLGLMFTLDEHEGRGVVEAWELWDGAAREYPGRGLLDAMAGYCRVHIRFYGVPAALAYDSPSTLELGRRLSEASRDSPQTLAQYLEVRVGLGDLTAENLESVQRDLDSLRRGEPVPQHYQPR